MGARIAFDYYDRLVILELWRCRCAYCGIELAQGDDHCDHVQPWSRGGVHALANIATACRPCNLRKGDRSAHEIGKPDVVDAALLLALDVEAALDRGDESVRGVPVALIRQPARQRGPVRCPDCPRTFDTAVGLRNHLYVAHRTPSTARKETVTAVQLRPFDRLITDMGELRITDVVIEEHRVRLCSHASWWSCLPSTRFVRVKRGDR